MVIRVACAWRILDAVPQCIHEQKIQSTTLFNSSHITHAWTGCPVLELHTTGVRYQSTLRNRRAHWGAKLVRFSPWRPQWLPGALDWPVCNQLSFPNVSHCLFTLILCFSRYLFCMKSIPWINVCLSSLYHSSSSCIRVRTQSQYFIQSASGIISALVCTDW